MTRLSLIIIMAINNNYAVYKKKYIYFHESYSRIKFDNNNRSKYYCILPNDLQSI